MRIEIIVEEPSAEEAMRHILPKLLAIRTSVSVINMGSKGRMLKELPKRLRAYKKRIDRGEDLRILILLDRDNDDCKILKRDLELMARDAHLPTKSSPDSSGKFFVANRIVVEELESWFIGDPSALRKAFPKLPKSVPKNFKNPDNGGSWERLHRFLKENGVYKNSYPKIDAARKIAPQLDPDENKSKSFHHFKRGLEALL